MRKKPENPFSKLTAFYATDEDLQIIRALTAEKIGSGTKISDAGITHVIRDAIRALARKRGVKLKGITYGTAESSSKAKD